ncbi:hypothetical protein GGQ84_000335 [Desulfitispora alkaliphila]|uniref:hypothetical protein n=1 Tax=Desulfitispora alkaliphila TaxID=622674 RepID=UPI003D1961F7
MKFKELISYIIIGLIGILLLNLYSANSLELREAIDRLMHEKIFKLHLLGVLYIFMLGILVKWRTVLKLVTRKIKLKLNSLLIPGIILLLISSIPPIYILSIPSQIGFASTFLPFPRGNVGIDMLLGPLIHGSIQPMLSALSGVIIIQGLHKNE